MRRLDYQLVSQAMNDSKPRGKADDSRHIVAMDQWKTSCVNLADAFETQTPAFERERFLKDCGYQSSPPRSLKT